ncbi:peptide deformylase [Candidatus Kaiserbacteria bacterium]|nr:peptide deformylase [Candidatus Kaiserbacteria bacterium]
MTNVMHGTDITQIGNKLIRAKAKKVSNPTSKVIQTIIKDLVASMHTHELVGIAAPQIAKSVRVFITEIRKTQLRKGQSIKNVDPLRIFINPKVLSVSKEKTSGWEGCGSIAFAHLFGVTRRPASVTIEALDEKGKKFRLKAGGLLARVIQHEIDHLDGVVFTDKADASTYMSRDEYLKLRAKKKRKEPCAKSTGR